MDFAFNFELTEVDGTENNSSQPTSASPQPQYQEVQDEQKNNQGAKNNLILNIWIKLF